MIEQEALPVLPDTGAVFDAPLENVIEAILFAAGRPMSIEQLAKIFEEDERPETSDINLVLERISENYAGRGIELKKVASGYRFQVRQEMAPLVSGLWSEKTPRYTRALLETLALITYRQPVTRGEIEEIRGVSVSSNIIRTLHEREWIRVVGQRDVPGRPAMYATTRHFLDYFNLQSLNDLPPLGELSNLDAMAETFDSGLQAEPQQDNVSADDQGSVRVSVEDDSKENTIIPDRGEAEAFQKQKEEADREVFSTVDELLANIKTDFVDLPVNNDNASDVQDETVRNEEAENTAMDDEAVENTAMDDEAVENTAMDDEAVENTAMDDEAVENTAMDDEAVENTAMDDEAVENTAMEDEAVENTAMDAELVENTAMEDELVENTAMEDEAVENTVMEYEAVQGEGLPDENEVATELSLNDSEELKKEAVAEDR